MTCDSCSCSVINPLMLRSVGLGQCRCPTAPPGCCVHNGVETYMGWRPIGPFISVAKGSCWGWLLGRRGNALNWSVSSCDGSVCR